MILLNFSHPLSDRQIVQIESLSGHEVTEVRGEMPHFDHDARFSEQVRDIVDRVGLSPEQWQTIPLILNLPGYSPAAAILLAELHGRIGHFPAILRLRPTDEGVIADYEVAEILNLQRLRNEARARRQAQ